MQTLLAYTLTAFGVMVAARIKQIQSFMALTQMLIMPLFFISGAMFPVRGLPTWLTVLNRIDPMTYAVDPIRRVVFNHLNLARVAGQRLDPGVTWAAGMSRRCICAAVVLALGRPAYRSRDRSNSIAATSRPTSATRSGRGSAEPVRRRRRRCRCAPSSACSARSKRDASSVCNSSSGSPARTQSPGLASITTPAPADTGSSLRARPAPSRQAATPTASASRRVRTPVARCRDDLPLAGDGQRRDRITALRGNHAPPRVHCPTVAQRLGGVDIVDSGTGQHLGGQPKREFDDVRRAAAGEHLDRLSDLERVAGRPPERRRHVGEQGDGVHAVRLPEPDHRRRQLARAESRSFMNAPVPTFTSRTSDAEPSAIFLLMIDDAISGIDSTVPVTSRSAYSLRSAGRQLVTGRADNRADVVELPDELDHSTPWPASPGIDSSLSSVPPV